VTEDLHPLDLIDRPRVLELLSEHLTSAWSSFDLPRPKEPELDEELHARLEGELPQAPGDPQQALSDAAHVLDASVSPSRPLYTAYIGSTGLEAGVLAGALQHAYDVNLASSAGAAELVEQQTLRWMAQFIGFPMREGVFTSGGMTSNLTALTAARETALPGSRTDGIAGRGCAVYCSDEAHHSVVRAVEVIGLGSSSVRRIPIDSQRRMRTDALAQMLDRDIAAGVTPIAVVATAGTTLTGAVDPLAEIAGICREHQVWMHVDGAYGGPLAAVPAVKHLFAGIARADSVTVDAHKLMGVQKSCSLVMLGREGALARAFSHQERYMLHTGAAHNAVDATLEYSRPVRSLKLWLAFRLYGADVLRGWIGETVIHARSLTALIQADGDFELLHDPTLSTVCFRFLGEHDAAGDGVATAADAAALDDLNRRLADAVARDGRVYLAAATVDGRTCLRVCFTNFRTRDEHVTELFDVVKEISAEM
jgi:aromatic-L-amino-acid/L-tryptophan decarboxylase